MVASPDAAVPEMPSRRTLESRDMELPGDELQDRDLACEAGERLSVGTGQKLTAGTSESLTAGTSESLTAGTGEHLTAGLQLCSPPEVKRVSTQTNRHVTDEERNVRDFV